MSNSHQVTIGMDGPARTGGATYDNDRPQLNGEFVVGTLGGGARKQTAKVDVLPDAGVGRGQNSPMLEPRMAGGVRPNSSADPKDLIVEVSGVAMTLAMAQSLGLVTQNAAGQREFVPAVVQGKVAEGRRANAEADAEALVIADQETADWLEQADAACTAAGMSAGLDDLVHAVMHAGSPQDVVELFSGISPDPEQTAVEFANVVTGWTEGLADALDVDVEEVEQLLDAAVEQHGLGAVVGRALAGAHRKSYGPILAMLKHRLS